MLAWPWDLALSSLLDTTYPQTRAAASVPAQPSGAGDRNLERLTTHDSNFGLSLLQNNCGEDEEDEGFKSLSSPFLAVFFPPPFIPHETDARLPAALMLRACQTISRLNPLRC